tara:strand:- start:460 stop:1047 length:588 start_codon:yes stop_codon:yes gene_type:complete
MKKDEKIILVDCDGVLVDWLHSFTMWMEQHGYKELTTANECYDIHTTYGIEKSKAKELVKYFNESATMCCLPPLRDSVKYVKKIHEDLGYVFHCITSLSLDQHAGQLRKLNLENLFGKTAFDKLVCLDTGADKDDALLPYLDTGCMWVEDKPENAELGANMGLNSILMNHPFSKDWHHEDVIKVDNWKEIYEMLV